MNPSDIFFGFFDQGQHLAAMTAPYAIHLLYLLIFIEFATIAITFMMSGSDAPDLLWAIVRLAFTGGFAYWWLVNAFALGMIVLGSFNQLGQNITGLPGLTPAAFMATAAKIAHILASGPGSSLMHPEIILSEGLLGIAITFILFTIGAIAIFTICAGMLIIGPGSIFVSFLPNRWTSNLSEGYFTWLVRTGVVILFFYVVLGTAQQFAIQWNQNLANACGAVLTKVPSPHLGGPPDFVMASPCTKAIPLASIQSLFGDVILLALICVGVPFTAGAMAGHGVSMAIEHLASAKYLGSSVARPLASTVGGLSKQISKMVHSQSSSQQTTLQQRMAAGAAAAARSSSSSQPTTQLPRPPSVNGGAQTGLYRGASPTVQNPGAAKPTVMNPGGSRPTVRNPGGSRPTVKNPRT